MSSIGKRSLGLSCGVHLFEYLVLVLLLIHIVYEEDFVSGLLTRNPSDQKKSENIMTNRIK